MPENKKKKGLLGDAWNFLSSAGAGVLGTLGDLEYAARNPAETFAGLLSLVDPNLRTSSIKQLASMPAQDSGTVLPTSDELTRSVGGDPYSMAGLAGGLLAGPEILGKLGRFAGKLRKLPAVERMQQLGADSKTIAKLEKAAKTGGGADALTFGRNFVPGVEEVLQPAAQRGMDWIWGGEKNTPITDPEALRFHKASIYEPNEKVPPVQLPTQKKSLWLRGMDRGEAAAAAEKGLHIDLKQVSKQLGFDHEIGADVLQRMRNGLANILEYGMRIVPEHSAAFYPESRDVIAAMSGGNPEIARKYAVLLGATSPNTSVPSSFDRAYAVLTKGLKSLMDPDFYLKTAKGKDIKALTNASKRAANFDPMTTPKVGSFTNELDPTIGGLLGDSNIFIGTVNDSHMYNLALMLAHDALKVDPATGTIVLDVQKFNEARRKAAKAIYSENAYKKFLQKLEKNPNAVPELRNVSTAMHKFMDGEFALLTERLGINHANTGQAVGWAVKQMIDALGREKQLTPQKAMNIVNSFKNTFAEAFRQATGAITHEPFFGEKASTFAKEVRAKLSPEEQYKLASEMGTKQYGGLLRDAGIPTPGAHPDPKHLRSGYFEGNTNPMAPIPIGIPTEGGKSSQYFNDIEDILKAFGIITGQDATAAGVVRRGEGAFRVKSPSVTREQALEYLQKLQAAGYNPAMADLHPFGGPIYTSFSPDETIPSTAKEMKSILGAPVEKVGYQSTYVPSTEFPATGTGENTRELLRLAEQNPNVASMLEGQSMREYAGQMHDTLTEAQQKYDLSRGLGPNNAINEAYMELYRLIKDAPNEASVRQILAEALKRGVPLPVVVAVISSIGGGDRNEGMV